MIGEDIRQITVVLGQGGPEHAKFNKIETEGCSIRRLHISTALILTDEKTAEIITSFKPVRSTAASDSAWYEFSIYSHNGSTWTKRCDGQARRGRDEQTEIGTAPEMDPLPPKVKTIYAIFDRVGLQYGPNFRGIQDLSVNPGHQTAVARLRNPPATGSRYSVQPTTIDQCLQLLGLAAANGLSRRLEHILLPTGIDNLYIQPCQNESAPLQARAVAVEDPEKPGNIHGQMEATKDNHTVLAVTGCKVSAFEQALGNERDDRIAAARLSWRPDLDFVPLESLMISPPKDLEAIRVMETYVLRCISTVQSRTRDSGSLPTGHMETFRQWIGNHVEEGRSGRNEVVPDSEELVKLGHEEQWTRIRELQQPLKTSEFVHVAELVTRLLDNCVGVFTGETQILVIYLQDNGLTKMYAITGDRIDSSEFFITAGHTNPRMRILEIGSGTGGTTLVALQALHAINGERMFASYT
jgi:hypothetical protein